MDIEKLEQENAALRYALKEALQSLEYIDSAYPQVAGKWKRIDDIKRGKDLLEASKSGG